MDSSSSSQDVKGFTELDGLIVYESDDEETIAQEELLEPIMQPDEELQLLEADLNMSLDVLHEQCSSSRSRRSKKKIDYQAMVLREQRLKEKKNLKQPMSLKELSSIVMSKLDLSQPGTSSITRRENGEAEASELAKFYLTNIMTENSEDDADADFKPLQKPRIIPKIRMGSQYQAEVLDGPLPKESATTLACVSVADELLWNPSCIRTQEELDDFLWDVFDVEQILKKKDSDDHPVHTRTVSPPDNEQALKILMKCNLNRDLALQKFKSLFTANKENIINEGNNKCFPSVPKPQPSRDA